MGLGRRSEQLGPSRVFGPGFRLVASLSTDATSAIRLNKAIAPASCLKQPELHSADTSYSSTCRSPGRTTTQTSTGRSWWSKVVPEKTTYQDARSEVKLCRLLGGGHSPGDLVFIARWCVPKVFEYLVGALHDIDRSHYLGSTHDFQRVEAVAELE